MKPIGKKSKSPGKAAPFLSVVAPMYNEGPVVELFYDRTSRVLDSLGKNWEIVIVDDGSRDDTPLRLRALAARDARVKCVFLSRNFGKDTALSAGLDHAGGELIVPTDADLQDPPELIPEMVARLQEGYDVVYMQRSRREGEGFFKRFTAGMFYQIISRMSEVEIPRNVGDFRIFTRQVLLSLADLKERHRFMKGLFAWVGFRQTSMSYIREARAAGVTRWNYWKLWNFALEGITSFTIGPLRIWSYVGAALAAIAFLYALFLTGNVLLYGIDVPGYASLMVAVLFLGGVQLITLGVLGEYVGRIFQEVKGRPLYVVRETLGEIRSAGGPARRGGRRSNRGDGAER